MWAEHEVANPATYLKLFRHPVYERLAMTTNSLAVLAVPGTRMVVYTPADEECRTAIGKLLAGEGTDAEYPLRARAPPAPRRASGRLRPLTRASAVPSVTAV